VYERAGFEKEGVFRNYTFLKTENKYLDEQVMSFLL
jgi:RimJ/RimL family protein N-acetyltransferase